MRVSELTVVYTLCEGNYDLGAGALLNSLCAAGFAGEFRVFYRKNAPRWLSTIDQLTKGSWKAGAITVTVEEINPPRHLGYHKPFAAKGIMDDPNVGSVFYFDPDITVLANWSFFESWVKEGFAVCLDSNTPCVSAAHPWRRQWRELVRSSGRDHLERGSSDYHNSGFFGFSRYSAEIIELWCSLTLDFEEAGGDTQRTYQNERFRAITGDQDVLAATLSHTDCAISTIGLEGMGFNHYFFIMAHHIRWPKPWMANYLADAMRGNAPSLAADYFMRFCKGPARIFSPSKLRIMQLNLAFAKLVSRFWRRA